MGVLTVKLLSGNNLKRKDILSKSDPFCELSVAGQQQRSRTIHNNQNPFWGDVFSFSVANPLSESLIIHVYDKDFLSRNDSLGYCIIPLNTLMMGQPLSRTYQLMGTSKGTLTVELTAQDFGAPMGGAAYGGYAAPTAPVQYQQAHYVASNQPPPPQPTYGGAYGGGYGGGYGAPPMPQAPVYHQQQAPVYYPPPQQQQGYYGGGAPPPIAPMGGVPPQNLYGGVPPPNYGGYPPPPLN